jgi:hypothetical protein
MDHSNRPGPLPTLVAVGTVAAGESASAAPAMRYPLYASAWNLTTTATTAIYAIYPVVVV